MAIFNAKIISWFAPWMSIETTVVLKANDKAIHKDKMRIPGT